MDVACSVTDRDRSILRLLRNHRVLTTSQVGALFFTDANTCRHRMTRLRQLRLVERFRLPLHALERQVAPSATGYLPATEYAYVLDRLGAYVLALHDAGEDEPNGDVTWRRLRWRTDQALAVAASPRLAHTLGVNQFFVDLAAASRRLPDAALIEWWGEAHCRDVLAGVVRPDGIGAWRNDTNRLVFALEYDRGSETLGRLAGKLDGYRRLEDATGWEFWLLVVLPGARREVAARAVLGRRQLAIATTHHVLARSPAGPAWAPLFANPHASRVPLAELTGWPRPAESQRRITRARANQRRNRRAAQ